MKKILKKRLGHNLFLVLIAAAIVAFDQWTKLLIRQNLSWSEALEPIPALAPFFRIVNWQNTGAAFGLFHNANLVLAILAVLISIVIVYYYQHIDTKEVLIKVALAMQLGGAIGNLVDRITQGYVTDFLSLGRFPVFNVADSSVTVGVALLLLAIYLQEGREKHAGSEDKPSTKEQLPDSNGKP